MLTRRIWANYSVKFSEHLFLVYINSIITYLILPFIYFFASHQVVNCCIICYENPSNCKEIQLVHPKGDQSWVFIGRTDVEAEVWPPDVKSWLIWKDPDAGKDRGQEEKGTTEEEKGTTEEEMAGWHHRLNGHGFWVDSGSWWWTGRPGVLRFMGSQKVGHDWVTELSWTDSMICVYHSYLLYQYGHSDYFQFPIAMNNAAITII